MMPLEVRKKVLCCSLSPELKRKYLTKNLPLRVGDEVRIKSGKFQDREGKVVEIDYAEWTCDIERVTQEKGNEGQAEYCPIHYGQLLLIKPKLDPERKARIQWKYEEAKQKHPELLLPEENFTRMTGRTFEEFWESQKPSRNMPAR